jgi:hypothetical protein
MMLTELQIYHKTNWEDYTVLDEDLYKTEIYIDSVFASDTLVLVALNNFKYNGYDGKGYSAGAATRGITEEEAYNIWIEDFRRKERNFIRQLKSLGLNEMSQSVFDGLLLYYLLAENFTIVYAMEGQYNLRDHIVNKNWDTVAGMILRDHANRQNSIRAATILRLADYGNPKTRGWLRANGIFEMRASNQIGLLSGDKLTRARFSYYAETLEFLPLTPNSIKRDIAKRYDETLITQSWVYDGSTVNYSLSKTPAMSPVEKLEVKVNNNILQYEYDYTLSNNVFTIKTDSIELVIGDIISSKIRI